MLVTSQPYCECGGERDQLAASARTPLAWTFWGQFTEYMVSWTNYSGLATPVVGTTTKYEVRTPPELHGSSSLEFMSHELTE